jgi:hypothetical protein
MLVLEGCKPTEEEDDERTKLVPLSQTEKFPAFDRLSPHTTDHKVQFPLQPQPVVISFALEYTHCS